MEINRQWWDESSEVHKAVFKAAGNIRKNQTALEDLQERHFRLYSGLPLYSAFTFNLAFDQMDAKFTMNVVQSATNTLVSKITKNKIKPTFLTDGGDWGMQQQAKKLDKYIFGQFYKLKVREEAKKAFRDACIFGDGFIKHWHDDQGQIHIRRVFNPCILIDQAETLYGQEPKTVYEIRIVEKDVLKEKYPDYKLEIDEASISDVPFFIDSFESSHNLVVVLEAFRVKIVNGKQVKMGKHFIGISTATFIHEDYDFEEIPYIPMQFMPNAIGFYSKGVAEMITGHQVEINRTLRRLSRSMNLMSSPHILVDYMSDIVDTHFNNEVGNIIKYKNTPPVFNFPQGVSPVVVEYLLMMYQKAFEEVGLSQLSAQSKKPEGLDSGRALREYNDIETERFAELAQNWEAFHLKIADAIIKHSVKIREAGGKVVVLSPNKYGAEKIDFKDIKLKDSEYIMQAYATNLLPKEPAGRLQFVQELIGMQILDPEEGAELLEFPDVSEAMAIKSATRNDIKNVAFLIIDKGDYLPPEPYQNLDFGIQYFNSMYSHMKIKGLPQERLDLLQRWINDALALKAELTPPEPVMPEVPMMEQPPI